MSAWSGTGPLCANKGQRQKDGRLSSLPQPCTMSDSDSPPPPPYEVSQRDFDRKVDNTLIASRNLDEEWETWSEAEFEAAARAHHNGGPSTRSDTSPPRKGGSPTFEVPPLNIKKGGSRDVAPAKPKERPSWFSEAGLEDPSSSSTYLQEDSSASSSSSSAVGGSIRSSALRSVHELPAEELEEDDDQTISPPPFTEVDHPPFQEITPMPAYHGNHSNPPSPLSSPVQMNAPPHHLPQVQVIVPERFSPVPPNRQSLPTPPRLLPPRAPRPITTTFTVPAQRPLPNSAESQLPLMPFDLSVAYQKSRRVESPLAQPIQQFQSPYTSLYNSVVTPHLSAKPAVAAASVRPQSTPPSNYPHNLSNSQQLTSQHVGNVTRWREDQAHPSSRHLLQPQHHSYPPSQSPQPMFPSTPMSHYPSDPRFGPSNGAAQGRWASSEQQMLQDVYRR